MRIDLTKTTHIFFFVVLLPLISFGVGWGFVQLFPNLPFWVEGISPLGAYALLYSFFDKVAWAWPFFSWLGTPPDLRGRWIGTQQSSHRNAAGKNVISRAVLEITQTASEVQTRTYYKRWTTDRCDASFMKLGDAQYLVMLFETAPNSNHTGEDGKSQKGVTRLQFQADKKQLAGSYFNSTGNYGEVLFVRHSRRLLQRFQP